MVLPSVGRIITRRHRGSLHGGLSLRVAGNVASAAVELAGEPGHRDRHESRN
jgi:hypothetical protein